MPKKPAHIRKYTENLLRGVKMLAEKSPRQKKRQKIENKENVSCSHLDKSSYTYSYTRVENAASPIYRITRGISFYPTVS